MTHARVMPVFRREKICFRKVLYTYTPVYNTHAWKNTNTALYTASTRPCSARAQRGNNATGEGTAIAHARVSLTAFARTFCLSKLRALK